MKDIFGNREILIIDDEASVVKVTSLMVERLGFVARGTVSGLDGVDLWKSGRDTIGALIIDIMLADTNGLDVYERIRPLDHNVPIVLYSGFSQPDGVNAILREDRRARFLSKPFGARDLQRVLIEFSS